MPREPAEALSAGSNVNIRGRPCCHAWLVCLSMEATKALASSISMVTAGTPTDLENTLLRNEHLDKNVAMNTLLRGR